MMIVRYLSSAALGLAVTAALLWMMQYLVELTDVDAQPDSVTIRDWFAEVRKDTELTTDEPKPQPIDPYVTPPPLRAIPESAETVFVGSLPAQLAPPPRGESRPVFLGPANGAVVAIVQVQPEYPPIARQRGMEGFVDVTFDVTEAGTVTNVSVVASSHRLFEKAAIRAAERSRYRPRMVDGVPLATTGLMKRFRFAMEN